jgi:DNA-directed RNA polymerase specialized sigma24 family protein
MARREDVGAADADLAAAAAGSQSAWDRLVERHAQRVWSTARGSGLDAALAADVCQLMWTRLVNHLDELSTNEQVREWLCAATEDEVCRVLRAGPSALNRSCQRSAGTD